MRSTDFKSAFFIPGCSLLNKPSITFQKTVIAETGILRQLSVEFIKRILEILYSNYTSI